MPKYVINAREVWIQKYMTEADDIAHAIENFKNDKVDLMSGHFELIYYQPIEKDQVSLATEDDIEEMKGE